MMAGACGADGSGGDAGGGGRTAVAGPARAGAADGRRAPDHRRGDATRGAARRQRGFTLVELLIIAAIIAILASIVISRFFSTKEKAMVAAMQHDLRVLVTAQDAYYSDTQVYASSLSQLGSNFRSSDKVTIAIDSATQTGWGATATHAATAAVCTVASTRTHNTPLSCSVP